MRRLRNSLLLFLLIVGFFLNIERVDLGGQLDIINIQTFVYLLAAGAVLSTVILPEFWRPADVTLIAIWESIYLLLKSLIFTGRPLIGGIYTYLSITEMAMLGLMVLAAYRVAKDIYDLEDTVATVTLGQVSERVKRLDQAEDDISKELARSRRYDTPLSVMVLKVEPENVEISIHHAAKDILQGMMKRYTANKLIRMLDRDLRRSDIVIDQPKDDSVAILLPETSTDGTAILASRIQDVAKEQLGLELSSGYASFPRDALTFDDLLNQAENQFSQDNSDFSQSIIDD
jgi:hypothetical protein